MHQSNRGPDPTRLGLVEDITGPTVSVKLDDCTAHGLVFVKGEGYRVGQVGSFVRIPGGYFDLFGIVSQVGAGAVPLNSEGIPIGNSRWLRVELVGEGRPGGIFERGISQYPSIGDQVHVVTDSDLQRIYAPGEGDCYVRIGRIASSEAIPSYIDLNRLVTRHSAVVGSTGSGKSTAVASLLTAISDYTRFPSARVVLLDLHGEYSKVFGDKARIFKINADTERGEHPLRIPFWALTYDELCSFAFGTIPPNASAFLQDSIFRAKVQSLPGGVPSSLDPSDVTVDSPLPFSIHQLWLDLYCHHHATHSVSSNQNQSNLTRRFAFSEDGTKSLEGNAETVERPTFMSVQDKVVYKAAAADQPKSHVESLESKLKDPRLAFLFSPGDWSVAPDNSTKSDLDTLLDGWIGSTKPISVFDLSGIPSTILDDLVGALLRLLYESVFWGRATNEGGRNRPLLVVLEEAHTYLSGQSKLKAATVTRRIAKEGRKYGMGLMLVSQRPSEIDGTILSQCGTMIALRLTNEADRGQVRSCSSDNMEGLFAMLPILRTGEALVVGEAVSLPVRTLIDLPQSGLRPDSEDPFVAPPATVRTGLNKTTGWTNEVTSESYMTLVDAWRHQDINYKRPVGPEATTEEIEEQ